MHNPIQRFPLRAAPVSVPGVRRQGLALGRRLYVVPALASALPAAGPLRWLQRTVLACVLLTFVMAAIGISVGGPAWLLAAAVPFFLSLALLLVGLTLPGR